MKGNVNPFEPWRPSQPEVPTPPVVNARQPWRPARQAACGRPVEEPPFVEPVEPQPARAIPPRRPPAAAPRRRPQPAPSALNTPVSELRGDQKVVLLLVFALGTLGLVGLGWLGGTHLPRVFLALLAVGAGLTVSVSLARRRHWFTRLAWMAGGLALAGLAGWFVPTTEGVSLWSAYRQVNDLRALPAGDVGGYLRGQPARREVVSEFPAFAADIADGERAWLRRTVDEGIEDADRLMETGPNQASVQLQKLIRDLTPLDNFSLVQGELQAARKRAFVARLKAAQEEIEALVDNKNWRAIAPRRASLMDELAGEARAVGAETELSDRFRALRRQTVTARLEAARQEIAQLLKGDRFAAVADLGAQLARDVGAEARAAGLADDLDRVCQSCAVFGDLARQAKKPNGG